MNINKLIPEAFKDKSEDIINYLRLVGFDSKSDEFICHPEKDGGFRIIILNELGKILIKSEIIS